MRGLTLPGAALVTVALLMVASAWAHASPSPDAPAGPAMAAAPPPAAQAGLRAAPAPSAPPRSEDLPAPVAVTVGFIALWALLLGAVVLLAARDSRLAEELDSLETRLEGPAPKDGTAP